MEGKDNIKDLFSEKLGNYEAPVNPELWANIASQIGATTTVAASTGMSLLTKILIGTGITAAAVTTAVLLTRTSPSDESQEQATTSQLKETTLQKEADNIRTNQPNTTTIGSESADPINTVSTDDRSVKSSTPNQSNPPAWANNPDHRDRDRLVDEDAPPLTMPTRGAGQVNSTSNGKPTIVPGLQSTPVIQVPDDEIDTPLTSDVAEHPIKNSTNIFTPNGDGTNDYFFLNTEGLRDFSIVIFDATGNVVFKDTDPNFRWDGRDISGKPLPEGRYTYIVSSYDAEGKAVPVYTTLTITR